MRKFLIITFLVFIIVPQQAFSFTWDTFERDSVDSSGKKFFVINEGYKSADKNYFPNCKSLNLSTDGEAIRQGKATYYEDKTKKIVVSYQKGIFDCFLGTNNQMRISLIDGISEKIGGDIIISFDYDEFKRYQFFLPQGQKPWKYIVRSSKVLNSGDDKTIFMRDATNEESVKAEKLLKFYRNLDVSSRSAKIYEERILNNSDSLVKKESTPKKNDWINKYNDNDIIPAGSGTGFFINRDGILLSNYHVIQGCASVSLYHNGVKYSSNIIASDRTNDIAIISSTKKSNQYFRVDKDGPSLLEEIFVAGYPLGLKVSNSLKVSSGRVSSLAGFGDNYANFQLDAAINPGNSGGPIINKKGNVVGIAVAYLPSAQGFNFGIKSSTVNSFVNSNKINFSLPNMTEMSNKELSKLMNEATVFIECSMKVKDIKAAIEKKDTKKVFYSEFRN